MEIKYYPHDEDSARFRTSTNRQRIEEMIKRGKRLETDPDKLKRQVHLQCIYCYYGGARIAGQAFTTAYCGLCKKETLFSSTDTDRICEDCANDYDLCQHCGADRELRKNRRSWPKAQAN